MTAHRMHCREEVGGPVLENPRLRIRESIQPVTATNEQGRKEYDPARREDYHRQKIITTMVVGAVSAKKNKNKNKKMMMMMLAAIR